MNIDRFKQLLESQMGNVKPLINEDLKHVEPLLNPSWTIVGTFLFPEGALPPIAYKDAEGITQKGSFTKDFLAENLKNWLVESRTYDTLKTFKGSSSIPQFIELSVGTSSTPGNNPGVAEYRKKYLKDIIKLALEKLYIKNDVIYSIIENLSTSKYKPSEVPSDFLDVTKLPPNPEERFASIKVKQLTTGGNEFSGIAEIVKLFNNSVSGSRITNARNYVEAIKKIGSYSDIVEINTMMDAQGDSFQDFLNRTLKGMTAVGQKIANWLDRTAQKSGKPAKTVRYSNGNIDLGLD